jgi:hypothetical protein
MPQPKADADHPHGILGRPAQQLLGFRDRLLEGAGPLEDAGEGVDAMLEIDTDPSAPDRSGKGDDGDAAPS